MATQHVTTTAAAPAGHAMLISVNGATYQVTVPPGVAVGEQFVAEVPAVPPPETLRGAPPANPEHQGSYWASVSGTKHQPPVKVAEAKAPAQPPSQTSFWSIKPSPQPGQPGSGAPKPAAKAVVSTARPMAPVVPHGSSPQPGTAPVMTVPPNAPPGGRWIQDNYCGGISWVIGILLLPCIVLCPVDKRDVYMAPDGRKYTPQGVQVTGPC